MGALQKFRQASPYALGAFAVVFIVFMVLQDSGFDGSSMGAYDPNAVIAKVNDGEITYSQFEIKVKELEEQMRNQAEQQGEETEINSQQNRSQIWNEMVEEIIRTQMGRKAGIVINDKVVADIMINNPPEFVQGWFTDSTGNFRKSQYLEMVTQPEMYVTKLNVPEDERMAIVSDIRGQLNQVANWIRQTSLQQSLMRAANVAGSYVSPLYASQKYMSENASANIEYIPLYVKDNTDEIDVTEDEIKSYYEKNKRNYKTKEQRKVKYVAFALQPSGRDSAEAQKRIQKLSSALRDAVTEDERGDVYDRYFAEYSGSTNDFKLINDIEPRVAPYITSQEIGGVVGPIRLTDGTYFFRLEDKRANDESQVVQASHILIKFDENKDSAKTVSEKLLKRAKSGEDFAKLAEEFSTDPGSARSGGDLGFFSRGRMVKEFEDAAFAANVGDVVGPVESQFGFHIIKVTDKKNEEIKYSEIKIAPRLAGTTRQAIMREALNFKEQLARGQNIDSLAIQMNNRAIETGAIEIGKPVLGSNYLSALVFENDKGFISDPIELQSYGFVVAQVSSSIKAGIAPIDDKRAEIENTIRTNKILDKLEEKANAVYNKVKSSNSLLDFTDMLADFNTNVFVAEDLKNNGAVPNGGGRDFVFTSKVMQLEVGKVSAPIRGEVGYYIAKPNSFNKPDENQMKEALTGYAQQLKDNAKANAYFLWFNQLKNDAKVDDKRTKFYKEF